jgi:hypothetical protein
MRARHESGVDLFSEQVRLFLDPKQWRAAPAFPDVQLRRQSLSVFSFSAVF